MLRRGGHFGAFTARKASAFLATIDAKLGIEPAPRGGYIVRDPAYRPGQVYWGQTPRKACIAAGFIPTEYWS